MRTTNRLLAVCLLTCGCGGNAKPASAPTSIPEDPAAAARVPSASVTCYQGTGAVMLPSGQQVATLQALARRTVDPDASTIVEEFVNLTPKVERYVVTLHVNGSKFTMTETSQAFTGEGELTGEPWQWTSWHSTSTLPDGTRVESTDEVTPDGIRVKKSVHGPDGTLQVTISEEFHTIGEEECSKRFAELDAAPAPEPAAVDDAEKEALAREVVAFMDELIEVVKNNQDNCDNMATELTRVIEEGKPVIARAEEMEKQDPSTAKWFQENYGTAMEEKLEKELMPAMMKCIDHEGVAEAMKGLE